MIGMIENVYVMLLEGKYTKKTYIILKPIHILLHSESKIIKNYNSKVIYCNNELLYVVIHHDVFHLGENCQ